MCVGGGRLLNVAFKIYEQKISKLKNTSNYVLCARVLHRLSP